MDETQVAGLLLAAGASTRMGEAKMVLPLPSGLTLLESATVALRDAGASPLVLVLGCHEEAIRQHYRFVDEVHIAVNEIWQQGMLSSVRCGVRALLEQAAGRDIRSFLLLPGDVPGVSCATVRALVAAAAPGQIVIPTRQGAGGHPTLFPLELAQELLESDLPQGLRTLIERHSGLVRRVELDDAGLVYDVDTPEDYRRLMERHDDSNN